MVYIDENSTIIYFPKVMAGAVTKITFTNQITHNSFDITVTDASTNNTLYQFDFSGLLSDFTVGQYDYEIKMNNDVLASGIAQYGDYTPSNTNYTTNIEIITYQA